MAALVPKPRPATLTPPVSVPSGGAD